MLSLCPPLSPNPHHSPSPKSLTWRDARAIAFSKRPLAIATVLHRRDDAAPPRHPLRDPHPHPLGSKQRKLPPPSHCLQPQPQAQAQSKASGERENGASVSVSVSDFSVIDFARFNRSSPIPGLAAELQTSIVTYTNIDQPQFQVDLVSVIHVADRRYYETLQERLAGYDCVLYEWIKSKHDSEQHPVPYMEGCGVTDGDITLLLMDDQVNCLNYTGRNWYNADLDLETYRLLNQERSRTLPAAAKDVMGSALKSDVDSSIAQFNLCYFFGYFWLAMVRFAVPMPYAVSFITGLMRSSSSEDEDREIMDDSGSIVMEAFELGIGPALKAKYAWSETVTAASQTADSSKDSVIIGERNKAAMEELKRAISRGEKRIAILYGAGHMPDFGQRLRHDFKMVPTNVDWLTAWSIRRPKSKYSDPFTRFLPFSKEGLRMLVSRSIFWGILLLDLVPWCCVVLVVYKFCLDMFRLFWMVQMLDNM